MGDAEELNFCVCGNEEIEQAEVEPTNIRIVIKNRNGLFDKSSGIFNLIK